MAGARDLSRPARLAQWDQDDQRLIQRLIDARLLTADRAAAGGQPTVEVSHEALLRAWPRLRSWLKERSQFVQWRAQDLAPNLERWLDGNKGHEFLLPRSLLDPALRWLHDYPDELAGPAAGYIQASKRRRTRRRSLITGAVAVLVVASLTAAGIFYSLQQTTVQRQNVAVSRLLIMRERNPGRYRSRHVQAVERRGMAHRPLQRTPDMRCWPLLRARGSRSSPATPAR